MMMRKLLLALLVAGMSVPAVAQTVSCDGTESGGSGPTRYAYPVTDPTGTMTDLYVGTEDGTPANYTAIALPAGWAFAIVGNPGPSPFVGAALGDDVAKTRHGVISAAGAPTGACAFLVHFSGPAGLPGGVFTFGFDHPWFSHDVEWETIDGVGATNAVWAAPNGGGVGPVHGPHCLDKFGDGGPPAGPPPDIFESAASFKVVFLDKGTFECTDLTDDSTAIGRSDPFQEGAPPMFVAGCDAAPIMGAAAGLYPLTSAIGLEPCLPPAGFPEGPSTRWEVHTEMLRLELTGVCGTIRAGQPYLESVATAAPFPLQDILLANEHRFSFGEVASLDASDVCNAFPADSFFNLFVEVEIDALGRKYYNLAPMVVRATLTKFPPDLGLPQSTYIHDPSFPPVPLFDENGCHWGYLQSAGHGLTAPTVPAVPEALPLISGPVTFGIDPDSEGLEPGVEGPIPNEVWVDADSLNPERLLTAYESSGAAPGSPPDTTNVRVPELVGDIEDPDVNPPRDFITGDAVNSFSFGRDGTVEPANLKTKNGNLFFSVGRDSDGTGCGNAVGVAKDLGDEAASLFASSVGAFGAYTDRVTIPLPGTTAGCKTGGTNYLAQGSLALGLRGGLCNELEGQDNVIALEIDDYQANGDSYYLTLIGEAAIIRNDCNGNGVPDSCDIDSGTSTDGNTNDVPDECENDCNGNGIADACDIDCGLPLSPCDVPGCGGSTDVNVNGVPDDCEPDCNGNGVRDADDIAGPTSDDDNFNGVPDECEGSATIFVYENQSDPGPYLLCDLAVFATASELGLADLDVIDALVLSDVTPGLAQGLQTPNGILDVNEDEVLFSLAPGSPSLGGLSAADIFYSDFDGSFVLFASAADLGLLASADVDAADIGPSVKGRCSPEKGSEEAPDCFEVTREQCDQAQWVYAGDDTTCAFTCGDNLTEGEEQCDGTDDTLCPGGCRPNCTCEPGTKIPAVSEWGLIVTTLLLLAAGTVILSRRRRAA